MAGSAWDFSGKEISGAWDEAGGGGDLAPGELVLRDGVLLVGAAQRTSLALEDVQMEAKPRMAGAAFARDFQVKPGERIE